MNSHKGITVKHDPIDVSDFERVDLRVVTIVKAEIFPEARKPAYKLWVDIGDGIIKTSSAQITALYSCENLVGRQVLCIVNFPPRQVGPFVSEVLVTGVYNSNGDVVLVCPDALVPNGSRLC